MNPYSRNHGDKTSGYCYIHELYREQNRQTMASYHKEEKVNWLKLFKAVNIITSRFSI